MKWLKLQLSVVPIALNGKRRLVFAGCSIYIHTYLVEVLDRRSDRQCHWSTATASRVGLWSSLCPPSVSVQVHFDEWCPTAHTQKHNARVRETVFNSFLLHRVNHDRLLRTCQTKFFSKSEITVTPHAQPNISYFRESSGEILFKLIQMQISKDNFLKGRVEIIHAGSKPYNSYA